MDIAYAMGTGGGNSATQSGGMAFLPLILMFVIFYFLLIRPQQKKQREQKEMLNNLKKGDPVVTTGGLYGRITGLTDAIVTLEISDKVRVRVARSCISGITKDDAKDATQN